MGRSDSLRVWLPAIRAGSGADVFTERLADSLRKSGHDPVLQWFDRRLELMPWVLARAKAPLDIDLVHAGSWQGFAFKRRGIPLVITEHQYIAHPEFAGHRTWAQALYHRVFIERCVQRSYVAADVLVTVSEYCADAMRKAVKKPVRVIHNWVDTDAFSPEGRPERAHAGSCDPGPFKLLFVGNPSRRKGADLLPALARLVGPEVEIQCLGGLRGAFSGSHMPYNMKLLPSRPPSRMPELYRSVDAALVPTRYEPFGYVALEAMACGIPVVGFNSSGTAEVCRNGQTALLSPVDDLDALAANIHKLARTPDICRAMGWIGRKRACNDFSETAALKHYVEVYQSEVERYVRCLDSL